VHHYLHDDQTEHLYNTRPTKCTNNSRYSLTRKLRQNGVWRVTANILRSLL